MPFQPGQFVFVDHSNTGGEPPNGGEQAADPELDPAANQDKIDRVSFKGAANQDKRVLLVKQVLQWQPMVKTHGTTQAEKWECVRSAFATGNDGIKPSL